MPPTSLSNCVSNSKTSVVGASSVADAAVASREAFFFFLAGIGGGIGGVFLMDSAEFEWRSQWERNTWQKRTEKRTWDRSETIQSE